MSQPTKYRDPHQGYSRVSEKRRAQRVIEDALAMASAESTDDVDFEPPVAEDNLAELMAAEPSIDHAAQFGPQGAVAAPNEAMDGRMIQAKGATTRVVRGAMTAGHRGAVVAEDAVDRLLASIRRHR